MRNSDQSSESLLLGSILALSGGFMDAYTYVFRGHVFANAQTGNILLFGINLSKGDLQTAIRYIFPVLAFTMGIVLADIVRYRYKNKQSIHWRQITILVEVILLFIVGFLPQSMNLLANSLVSFACGIQVESFRKINGNALATTMCIGNLRTATQALCEYCHEKNIEMAKKSALSYGIIVIFVIGAVLGDICVSICKEKAILISSILLLLGFLIMFCKNEKQKTIPL